jgi:hypothetical protein
VVWGRLFLTPAERNGGKHLPILTMNLTTDGKEDS